MPSTYARHRRLMTGSESLRCVLDRLEPVRCGIYWGDRLPDERGADLAVLIRAILVRGGRAALHTGAGIVADSDPDAEWRETLDKAGALLDALAACGARDAARLREPQATWPPSTQATWPPSIASAAPVT
jgi:hypothetical protein